MAEKICLKEEAACLITVWQMLEKGEPLNRVLEGSQRAVALAEQASDLEVQQALRIPQQLAARLMGSENASVDESNFVDADRLLSLEAGFTCGICLYHLAKQMTSFTFGEYADALVSAHRAANVLESAGATFEATHYFLYALTLAALYPHSSETTRQEYRIALSKSMEKLERWAETCPAGYRCRYLLVLAEIARLEGRTLDAMHRYDEAITSAAENGFVYVEALANELAAKFYRTAGFEKIAGRYVREAQACYLRWGAVGKANRLVSEYAQLLQRLASIEDLTHRIDIPLFLKISRALSSELLIDRLVPHLAQIAMELVGAQKSDVILCRDGRPTLEAEALNGEHGQVDLKSIESQPVIVSSNVPNSIVQFVARTERKLLLEDARTASEFAMDAYILRVKPRSVLCVPMIRQAQLVGMLYVENKFVAGAFTSEHLTLLDLFASQAAALIENAQIHCQTLEALRMRDEFLALASYELRTPTTSLLFALESMRRSSEPLDPEKIGRRIEIALRQGKRLSVLINDLFQEYRKGLSEKLRKLNVLADHHPTALRYLNALSAAKVAHLDSDDLTAMRCYEEAISHAAHSGCVQVETLANELAAGFYRALGFTRISEIYLREAQACSAIEIVKASQVVSSELMLDQLFLRIAQVAVELTGAQNGKVILCREDRQTIEAEAEAKTEIGIDRAENGRRVEARLLASQPVAGSSSVPMSIVQLVVGTKKSILLEHATAVPPATDVHVRRRQERSVLCVPILRESEPIGVLYLEKQPAKGAFTVEHGNLLEQLATQAAISIQNAQLHRQTLEALRMRDEFLAVASHELRTPITSLLFALGAMRRWGEPADFEGMHRRVEVALRQGKRLSRLINDLFDLSCIDGGIQLSLGEFELAALVQEVARRLSYEFQHAHCSLSIRSNTAVIGWWDRSRIDQVITNLFSNAVKFGAGHPIEVAVSQEGDMARLAMKDFGIGISPAHQADIFKRFGRAVSSRQYGGLGLGLYICRRVVEAHGGTIQVLSQEGAGATFIVNLPIGR
jgi:signal transduction histidine kinase